MFENKDKASSEPLISMNIQDTANENPESSPPKEMNLEGKGTVNAFGVETGGGYISFDSKDQINRTIFQRTFGAMDAGSVRGSIFTLCSVTVGTGVLALPFVFKSVGFMLGIIILGISTLASLWS
jgi:hypothetical protein